VAFEYRAKHDTDRWKAWWDRAIFIGSVVPAFMWGVAFANMVHGVPIDAQQNFTGNLLDLLHPYALLAGLASLTVFTLHGAVYLSLKTKGELVDRSRAVASRLSVAAAALVFVFLLWTYLNAVSAHNTGVVPGVIPISALGLAISVPFLVRAGRDGLAFTSTALTIGLMTATIFLNLYPRVLVSSTSSRYDLTIWNTSSSHYTLVVMSVVALLATPVVLVYQTWTYHVFRHRIGHDDLAPIKMPLAVLTRSGSHDAPSTGDGE
jgi:cytochrome d ubiquinol oxidase subunit II